MKIVVAIDSLKGSLSSLEAGNAVKRGILKAYKSDHINVIVRPLADGGEGTVDALVLGAGGTFKDTKVTGPMMKEVSCQYGFLPTDSTAVIEMSGAAGLNLVNENNRNPMKATTYGVGEVIKEAVTAGARNFIVGIGGSATNDCGVGMLMALGYRFFDADGQQVGLGAENLDKIVLIDETKIIPELKECNFKVACDVTNPLCGENGASHVFGPQKGASKEMVLDLDSKCKHFAKVVGKHKNYDYSEFPGAGAAGGMGFAFISFLNCEMQSGIDIVLNQIRLEEDLKDADYVVTGEGRIDFQTSMGKAPVGVARLAKKYGIKVIGIAGCTTEDAVECNEHGIDAFFSIVNEAMLLQDAMKKENAERNMENTAEQIFRLVKVVSS